jgi:hypothetical protein
LDTAGISSDAFRRWRAHLQHALRQEQLLADLFWWQQTLPDADKGSLLDIERLCRQAVVLLLDVAPDASGMAQTAGLGILNDIIPGVKAQMTVWYPRGLTTHAQRLQVSQAVLRWCLTDFGLQEVWAQTINPRAAQHFGACGARLMAVVPDGAWYQEQRHDIFHLRLTTGDLFSEVHNGR